MTTETLFHVTVVSNFARAFDKYSRIYDKAAIGESRFPDRFFLLRRDELHIGIHKAQRLLAKTGIAGDRLLVLQTEASSEALQPNESTGLGRFVWGARISVTAVHELTTDNQLSETSVEETMAASLKTLHPQLHAYARMRPRTLSVLPIARACQAACRFCFSESSASLDQTARRVDFAKVERWLDPAVAAGAERFVITGGGEPGLVRHEDLVALIKLAASRFSKVVLITNGVHLAKRTEAERLQRLRDYEDAALSVLALSRHHDRPQDNEAIMQLDTGTEQVLRTWRENRGHLPRLQTRLICVLQKGGIESSNDIRRYLAWAAEQGVPEVCFKELYVSTTLESAYHAQPENAWALAHQVPLALLIRTLREQGFVQTGSLPWGAPLYAGRVEGRPMRVAAYTEPSLYWERIHGIARSWNLMAEGQCLVSLEDPGSEVNLPGQTTRRVFPMVAA